MRSMLALLLLPLLALGQGAPKKTEKKAKLKPLPEGRVRVLKAVVIDVEGTAQARGKPTMKKPKPKWSQLRINDVLEPGVLVRTGRKSRVTLRIGANATMLIERQSRVSIPEIVQKGKVLRTRVSMGFGKADVKVDRIGLDNDFEVATPTATLAVRGTAFRIWWDAVQGYRCIGVPANRIRAIEVRYLEGVKAYLSKADGSSEVYRLPALDGFYETYLHPLEGAISPGELGDPDQDPDRRLDPLRDTGLDEAQKARAAAGQRNPQPPTGAGN